LYLQATQEALGILQAFQNASFTNKWNRIQEEIDIKDERTKREIE